MEKKSSAIRTYGTQRNIPYKPQLRFHPSIPNSELYKDEIRPSSFKSKSTDDQYIMIRFILEKRKDSSLGHNQGMDVTEIDLQFDHYLSHTIRKLSKFHWFVGLERVVQKGNCSSNFNYEGRRRRRRRLAAVISLTL